MPAGSRVPGVVEEDDAEIGAVVVRRAHEAAVHVGVPTRLVDEQLSDRIKPIGREAAPFEDRRALRLPDAARHDAKRLPARVVVGRPNRERGALRAHDEDRSGPDRSGPYTGETPRPAA